MAKPNRTGWHWFLPDENCPTPTGLLRIDKPVVVLVGQDKYTCDGNPPRLVVRLPTGMMYVDDMSGEWQAIREPIRMKREANRRIKAKIESALRESLSTRTTRTKP